MAKSPNYDRGYREGYKNGWRDCEENARTKAVIGLVSTWTSAGRLLMFLVGPAFAMILLAGLLSGNPIGWVFWVGTTACFLVGAVALKHGRKLDKASMAAFEALLGDRA